MSVLDQELKSVITTSSVFSCHEEACLGEVVDLLSTKGFGSVCVVDDDDVVVGIFTERDFLTKVGASAGINLFGQPIKNFMTKNPVTVREDYPIRRCFGFMRMGKFRHLIVVDENNRALRMISIKDAFYFLCDSF